MEEDTAKVYLADDVDKHIEDLKQRNEEIEKASADLYNVMLTIAENEGILEKESADEFYNCMVRVKQLLKGKSDD